MLSVSSSHERTGEIAAPQPQPELFAGLAGATCQTQPMTPDSPPSAQAQADAMPMPPSSFSSHHNATGGAGLSCSASSASSSSFFGFSAGNPGSGPRQLPKLNTSFSLASAAAGHPAQSNNYVASPEHHSASSFSSSANNSSHMSLRNNPLKPTASASFADNLSNWSFDCVGPPLDESSLGAEEDASMGDRHHVYRKPDPLPQFGFEREDHHPSPWHHQPPPHAMPPSPPPEHVLHCRSAAPPTGLHVPGAPALEEQQIDPSDAYWDQQKANLVDGLSDVAMVALDSIWPPYAPADAARKTESTLLPIEYFINETIRRSRSTPEVLQIALYYLHRARGPIRERIGEMQKCKTRFAELVHRRQAQQHAADYPSPPSSPVTEEYQQVAMDVMRTAKDPIVCGRRMFLAALVIASKFVHDRTYSNRAWAKLSGLTVQEVSAYERALLEVLDYRLFVSGELFENWQKRLCKLQEQRGLSPRARKMPNLNKSASEYRPSSPLHGLHAPSAPSHSPSPSPVPSSHQQHRAQSSARVGRSTSVTDSTGHQRPGFFPAQSMPQQQQLPKQRRSSLSNEVVPDFEPPHAKTDRYASPSASLKSTPQRPPMPRQPSTSTPLRPSSRSNGLRRAAPASLDLSSQCKPAMTALASDRGWLHAPTRSGIVY